MPQNVVVIFRFPGEFPGTVRKKWELRDSEWESVGNMLFWCHSEHHYFLFGVLLFRILTLPRVVVQNVAHWKIFRYDGTSVVGKNVRVLNERSAATLSSRHSQTNKLDLGKFRKLRTSVFPGGNRESPTSSSIEGRYFFKYLPSSSLNQNMFLVTYA